MFVPGDAQLDDDVLLATGRCGRRSLGVLLLLVYDRLPLWAFHVVRCSAPRSRPPPPTAGARSRAYGPLPYVWVTLFVFYFFTPPAALVHLALMAAGVRAGARLEESPDENPLDGWIATVATLLVTGSSSRSCATGSRT